MPWTFPYLGETEDLNTASRADAPGEFIQLTDGMTHYEIGGPKHGVPVVLVHGFSVPYFIWDPTFTFLTESGFLVLRYDLFGRGYSDRPKTRYHIDLFCKQLRDLLDKLGFEKINLIGLSMGGAISASFTTRYPEKVNSLIFVDPAGARSVTLSGLLKAVATPGFGELALGLFGRRHMAKKLESDFYNPDNIKEFLDRYLTQMKFRGFMSAILSTVRNGMLKSFSNTYYQIGELGTPTAIFWGRNDKTVPFEHSNDLRVAIPQAEFHAIEDCGHIPHYEMPDVVNPLLLKFIRSQI